MDFNSMITTFSSHVPIDATFLAQTIVSAFISAMFANPFDKKVVIHEAKVGFLTEIITDLHKSNAITATEFLKCKNLADIAKLADDARAKRGEKIFDDSSYSWSRPEYDLIGSGVSLSEPDTRVTKT